MQKIWVAERSREQEAVHQLPFGAFVSPQAAYEEIVSYHIGRDTIQPVQSHSLSPIELVEDTKGPTTYVVRVKVLRMDREYTFAYTVRMTMMY